MSTQPSRALFQARDEEVSPVFSTAPAAMSRPAWSSRAELPAASAVEQADPMADALAKARAEGVAEGRAAVGREIEQTRERLQAALADVIGLREKVMVQSEEDLVRLALLMTETLVGGNDAAREGFTRTMLKQAMDLMRQADSITLRVNPGERAAVVAMAAEVAPATTTRVIDDISVGRGGVVVESELGRVDATLKRALADVAKELGLKVADAGAA